MKLFFYSLLVVLLCFICDGDALTETACQTIRRELNSCCKTLEKQIVPCLPFTKSQVPCLDGGCKAKAEKRAEDLAKAPNLNEVKSIKLAAHDVGNGHCKGNTLKTIRSHELCLDE